MKRVLLGCSMVVFCGNLVSYSVEVVTEDAAVAGFAAKVTGEVLNVASGTEGELSVFWGEDDGGEIVTGWAHKAVISPQGPGEFEVELEFSAADQGKDYYFRAYYASDTGSDWSDNSRVMKVRPLGYTEQDVDEISAEFDRSVIDELKAQGLVEEANSMERELNKSEGQGVDDWQGWVSRYNASVTNPPISYSAAIQPSVSVQSAEDVVWMLSFLYCAGRFSDMHNYADESGKKALRTSGIVDGGQAPLFYRPNATDVTVLLSATEMYDGEEYKMVFYRMSDPAKGAESLVFFIAKIFKKVGDKYLLTGDRDGSDLEAVLEYAGYEKMSVVRYKRLEEKFSSTALPVTFYRF